MYKPPDKMRKCDRVCGICGKIYHIDQMVRDEGSDTGWICDFCLLELHPEYEDWGQD